MSRLTFALVGIAQYQHILLRKGKDAADDTRRQTVLNDMLEWLDRH